MRSFSVAIFTFISLLMLAHIGLCDVMATYRCKSGRTGSIVGRHKNSAIAKEVVRSRARQICRGMLDYVRFTDSRRHG